MDRTTELVRRAMALVETLLTPDKRDGCACADHPESERPCRFCNQTVHYRSQRRDAAEVIAELCEASEVPIARSPSGADAAEVRRKLGDVQRHSAMLVLDTPQSLTVAQVEEMLSAAAVLVNGAARDCAVRLVAAFADTANAGEIVDLLFAGRRSLARDLLCRSVAVRG